MAKKDEFSLEVNKEVFEKVIADLGLLYSEPMDYFKTDDGKVFTDYWYDGFTGLSMAKRFNGYSDVPEDDPNSKPRYFITEYAAKKADIEQT